MASHITSDLRPRIVQWIIDTRTLWPVSSSSNAKDEVQKLKIVASRELSLLSDAEQTSVLKYYHLRDAKMSLASHLLKHMVIMKYCNIPWSQTTITRDSKGKPNFIPNSPDQQGIDFNVSHQAGIVSLIAAVGFGQKVDVGTDVVCWNERQKYDYAHIEKDGLFDWIDMHSEVFADTEVSHMKLGPLDLGIGEIRGYGKDTIARCERRGGTFDVKLGGEDDHTKVCVERNTVVDAKLRRFSAMWCLREAFVKMTGDALLAPWLKELEILDVQSPAPRKGVHDDSSLEEGAMLKDFRIFFKGRKVSDVRMEISAHGANYMIAASVRKPGGMTDEKHLALGRWHWVNLEENLALAEKTTW